MAVRHIDDPLARIVELEHQLDTTSAALTDALSLADRVDALLARVTGPAPLADVRAAMNEVDVHGARRRLEVDAIDTVENALLDLRVKQQVERDCRDRHTDALTEAKWGIEASCFTSRSGKTWRHLTIDGQPIPVDDQQSYDAKAKAEWVDYHANRVATVSQAARVLRDAEENTRMAADQVTIADKRYSAAKHSLDAAAAQLAGLIRCTPREA